jgi:phage-related protein
MAETPTMEVRARLTAETAQFTKGMQQATQSMNAFTQQSTALRGAMTGIGVAAGAAMAGVIAFGTKAFMAAARVDELDVAMNAVGKSTGLGYQSIRDTAVAIKEMGIEMAVAQQSAIKFAQNNLKLSYASELARAAQDLAVVSGMNSTDTYNMLTHAVITGRSEVLKSVGIQKSAGQMYEEYAKSIGKSATALTYQEKQQAVATGALKEAENVAGAYLAAMESPGKVLRSFARLHNEIQVSIGAVLLKGFGPMIKSLYDFEKAVSKALEKSKPLKDILAAMQMVLVKLTTPIKNFIDKLTEFAKKFTDAEAPVKKLGEGVQKIEPQIMAMAEKFEMLLPVLASVGAAFATFAGKQLFSAVPILGSVMSKLSPLPVALLVLALTSTQVRTAIGNLFNALKPILPIFLQFGKIMGAVSVIAVALLAKAINILAGIVRGSINFVKTYIGVFKVLGVVLAVLAVAYYAYMAQVTFLNAVTAVQTRLTTMQTAATTGLTVAQARLNGIMLMNPIGVYIAAIAGLITAFVILMNTNESFAKVVRAVFNFVIKTVIYVLAYIVKAIGYLLKAFAMWIRVLGFVAEVIAKVFEFIIDVVLTYYQFQLKVIKFIVDAFINLMESHGILYDVVKAIFNGIIKVISLVVEGIIRVLAFVIGVIADLVGAFNDLFGAAKTIFLGVLTVISKVGDGIFGVLENIASGVGKFLGWVFDKMTGWIRALAALFEKIPLVGGMIASGINSGLDAGQRLVTGFASTLVGFGKTAFDGILSGVKTTVNGIAGVGTAVEKGLRDTEKTLTNFAVKVQEFGNKDNGAKIIDVLVAGAKMASGALGKMIDVIQDVKDFDFARTVGNFINGIADKADAAGEFLIGLSASMMEFADNTDFASAVGDGIGDFINKIKDSLKEGLGFGDILAEEKKKYSEASNKDDGTQAAEDAAKAADRMKAIREAMQAGIDSIKGVLDDLRKASGEFADSLKDTIMGFAGLKSIELPDGFIPKAKSLIENMRQRLDKSNQFAQQIATLQAMGLDSGALKDIIESGPVKGAQLAASILGGGAEAIAQINSLQKAISFSGAAIGQYGADAAFGGLIGNAQAQLNRLTEAELATRTSGNNQFIQQGAFQVVVNTSGAKNTEEEIKMITDKIEQTFAILAKELAAK